MTKWSSGNRTIGGIPQKYYELLRDVSKNKKKDENDRPLKKRRSKRPIGAFSTDQSSSREKTLESETNENDTPDEIYISSDDKSDSSDDDMWEQVDIEDNQLVETDSEPLNNEPLEINLRPEISQTAKKRHVNILPKSEKDQRLLIHKLHLICLLSHVSIRNHWCNDVIIRKHYKRILPANILQELHPPSYLSITLKTRKFLDGLRHAMNFWNNRFKIYNKSDRDGLLMLGWDQVYDKSRSVDRPVDLMRFKNNYLLRFRGNRDMAAQGFCALLRSVNVETRLICSLQPLDFTSNVPSEPSEPSNDDDKTVTSRYPVFWIESWDKYGKNWVTVDPIAQKLIDIVRRKSKLEPPISDKHNLLRYVVAFDRKGYVTDVTRRYANFYNAKTRKKRVTVNLSGRQWWINALDAYRKPVLDDRDLKELTYFSERETNEEMPRSIEDFKGHPLFVLEQHLKQKEILEPKTVCGQLALRGSSRGKSTVVPIYSRKNVKELKSEVSWYRLGRVVKKECQPKKLLAPSNRKRKFREISPENEESAGIPLFSEDQTDIYHPPAVINGKLPKNRFGNIDIYTESMIPSGAVHLPYNEISVAARLIGVDYAEAVTGFDFHGKRVVRPTVMGIVVAEEHGEAVMAVYEQLLEEQRDENERHARIKALIRWRRYLIALRIRDRLNKKHGVVDDGVDDGGFDRGNNEGSGARSSRDNIKTKSGGRHINTGSGEGIGAGSRKGHTNTESNGEPTHMESDKSSESLEIIENLSSDDETRPSNHSVDINDPIHLSDSPLEQEPEIPISLNNGIQKSDDDSDGNDIQFLRAVHKSLESSGRMVSGLDPTVSPIDRSTSNHMDWRDRISDKPNQTDQTGEIETVDETHATDQSESGEFLADSMSESEL